MQRDYHACLSKLLESFIASQTKGILFPLRIGDQVKMVKLKIPLAFVVNDAKSADMLCGRYGSYSHGCICRSCLVSFEESSNTNHRLRFRTKNVIQELQHRALGPIPEDDDDQQHPSSAVREEAAKLRLKEMSCHLLRNAFDNVCFGGDPRGIYGATPIDLMHAFNEGVLKYCMESFFLKVTPSRKKEIDHLVDEVMCPQRSSVRHLFPRVNFTNGFTNLTLLTATERVGVCFTLMILSMMKRGQAVLGHVLQDYNSDDSVDMEPEMMLSTVEDDEESTNSSLISAAQDEGNAFDVSKPPPTGSKRHSITIIDLIQLLECLMAFHAWTKCVPAYTCSAPRHVAGILASIKHMMDMIKTRLPREYGNGWKLQKFHSLLHVPDDMSRFGSPHNTDTGCGERHLKDFAKKPASTCQKRSHGIFLRQVAFRLHQTSIVARAKRMTDPEYEWGDESIRSNSVSNHSNIVNDITGGEHTIHETSNVTIDAMFGSKYPSYCINFDQHGYTGTNWRNNKKERIGHVEVHPLVVNWFKLDQRERKYVDTIDCYTEYKRDKNSFRAHPNFNSNGSWYDWVMIRFSTDDNQEEHGSKQRRGRKRQREDQVPVGGSYPKDFYPCKILCFFRDPVDGDDRALVHACKESNHEEDSALCEVWYLEYLQKSATIASPVVYSVPLASFDEPVLVFQEFFGIHQSIHPKQLGVSDRCVLITNRERLWADAFH
jgi:hypothetical protein